MKQGKICVAIKGPSYLEAADQIEQAFGRADVVELRIDLFQEIDLNLLRDMKEQYAIPMIFSLRDKSQGGNFEGSEEERLSLLFKLGKIQPAYMDLEAHISQDWIERFSAAYPDVKIILSYHDFKATPLDIDSIFFGMKKKKAFFYKLAFFANSSLDALRLLCWTNEKNDSLITISMGDLGQASRILGPVVGSMVTYSCLDEHLVSAPGQMPSDLLKDVYRYEFLNRQTAIYALMGNTVSTSISHLTHNSLIERLGENAVYVKFPVKEHEVPEFLQLIRRLPFKGLSVTMPLKEVVINYLDEIDEEAKEIGAVNTLVVDGQIIKGYNTDSVGALNAIEKEISVRGKRLVIIGAGGAAKAIAFEASRRGAKLTILNRSLEKAEALAGVLKCEAGSLDDAITIAEQGYDILINSTPCEMPIDPNGIVPGCVVMDIKTRAFDTPLLQEAEAKGCIIVFGYEMFVEQAVEQFLLWFGPRISPEEYHQFLREKSLACLS